MIAGDASTAHRVLRRYRHLASWYLCDLVRRSYGRNGSSRVWPNIAAGLGLPDPLPQSDRKALHGVVAELCQSLGLPVPPERRVALFQLHAGVATAQLGVLAEAFLAQEDAAGFPPEEDGHRLNLWEDQALDYVHPSLSVLRMPILWDATAWHAALYARCRRGDVPENDEHAARFAKQLTAAQTRRRSTASGEQAKPVPRLTLDGMDLALRLPEGSGRVHVICDGAEPLRLRGGLLWPLPQPLPHTISWRIGDRSGVIEVLGARGSVLVADREQNSTPVLVTERATLSMTRVAIFARAPIETAGASAFPTVSHRIGPDLHLALVTLDTSGSTFRVAGRETVLVQRPHRRLVLHGDVIGTGAHGALHGTDATLSLSTGLPHEADRLLAVDVGGRSPVQVRVRTDDRGHVDLSLAEVLSQASVPPLGGPEFLRFELMRPEDGQGGGPTPSGLRSSATVWPGWRGRSGLSLLCDRMPANISLEDCHGIATDSQGLPCIERQCEDDRPVLAFMIGDRLRSFRLSPGELTVTHLMADGTERPLPRGGRIVLDAASRNGAIRIRCRDEEASLDLCGIPRARPFHAGSTCTLPLRAAVAGWIRLLKPNGVQVDLAEIVAACAYENLAVEQRFGQLAMAFRVAAGVDALRVELEAESRDRLDGVVSFRPDAFPTRPPAWLSATLGVDRRIEMSCEPLGLPQGIWFGRVSLRDAEGWHPLTSPRGDVVSFALDTGSADPDEIRTTSRLGTVLGWLSICHAPESWNEGRVGAVLIRRCGDLAGALSQSAGGRARLLALAHSEAWRESDGGWMPPLHLLDHCPDLHESPLTAFHAAGSFLSTLAEFEAHRLREIDALHASALLGFANAVRANATGEPLRGFDAERFFERLTDPSLDSDPFAGRRWNGRPLLGPAHWRAAHEGLADRIADTGFFGEDPEGNNGLRSEMLLRLTGGFAREPGTLPPVPPSLPEGEAELHARLSATLRAYSRAARGGRARQWLLGAAQKAGLSEQQVSRAFGDLLRLAPELFAFHMLIAELENRR